MSQRQVWFTDANGAEVEGEVSLERLDALVAGLELADGEHASVSVTDSDGWNLEYRLGEVVLERVGEGGEEVGSLNLESAEDAREIAAQFLAGDFEALRAHGWRS
jgi:hypothetical protein